MVGNPERIQIEGIIWDDDIEAHFARHEVALEDVMAVLDSSPLSFRNVEGRGGSHVLIGLGARHRILYISLRRTTRPAIWEPATGWESRFARRLWQEERGET